jgi:predicted nucleotidyltransferase
MTAILALNECSFYLISKEFVQLEQSMLSESDEAAIIRCAEKYKVGTIYLFGSSLDANTQARDIDLGVKGVNPAMFFKFYGELLRHLSKPVDLVDLSHQTLFNELVEKRGAKIYG